MSARARARDNAFSNAVTVYVGAAEPLGVVLVPIGNAVGAMVLKFAAVPAEAGGKGPVQFIWCRKFASHLIFLV